jgi:hypothetical protein
MKAPSSMCIIHVTPASLPLSGWMYICDEILEWNRDLSTGSLGSTLYTDVAIGTYICS